MAVDASRVRSGGGIAHIMGVLDIADPTQFGIDEIHVWAYERLLKTLPDRTWLVKHHPPELELSLFHQLYWQGAKLAREIKASDCQILFSVDASTVCRFKPMVVLSQNMLAYEDGVLALFGWGRDRIQQTLMLHVQKKAFKAAQASIFLTEHSARRVQRKIGELSQTTCIAHGVGDIFKKIEHKPSWPLDKSRPIKCLYVSPILEYKHQCEVVQAIRTLRDQGHNIRLTLVGGGGGRATSMLTRQLKISDAEGEFVECLEFLPTEQVANLLSRADLFIFASSCETFGIALLEAMAAGVPIACSSRSSLPESLQDAGEYFDPQNINSIVRALERLIENPEVRDFYSSRAKELASSYSWESCARETWQFVVRCYRTVSAIERQ